MSGAVTLNGNTSPLGVRIRDLRRSRGWSAQRLCTEANWVIGRVSISELENGHKHDITLTQALGLSEALGITVDQLIAADSIPEGASSMTSFSSYDIRREAMRLAVESYPHADAAEVVYAAVEFEAFLNGTVPPKADIKSAGPFSSKSVSA